MSQFNPAPVDTSLREPKRSPKRVVPSYIGEANQALNLLMHKGAGDVVKDYSGHNNDGEILGPEWTDEQSASWELHFNASENDYVEVPNDPSINISTGDVTWGAWFYLEEGYDRAGVVQHGQLNPGEPGYNMEIQIPLAVRVGILDQNDDWNDVEYGISTGQWYCAWGVRDGDTLRLIVNGKERGTSDVSAVDDISTTDPLRIGRRFSDYFQGYIGMAGVYRGAFTSLAKEMHDNMKPLYVG